LGAWGLGRAGAQGGWRLTGGCKDSGDAEGVRGLGDDALCGRRHKGSQRRQEEEEDARGLGLHENL
jgi:hypothetical protein